MTRRSLLAVGLFVLLTCSAAMAQDWTTYDTGNSSLEHNQVEYVCGDNAGKVWLGLTYNGVNVFDGQNWQLYNDDNSGLSGNYIRSICKDPDGVMWFATHRGISSFNEDTWTWTSYTTSNCDIMNNSVKDVTFDYEGTLWAATSQGVSEFDGTNWTNYDSDSMGLTKDEVRAIAAAPNGDIWIGTSGDGAGVLRGSTWTLYSPSNCPIAGYDITDVMVDSSQNVWCACIDSDALSVYSGSTWTTYNALNSGFDGERPDTISQHPDGSIWVATSNSGIYMLFGGTWTSWGSVSEDGIASTCIRHIGFDSHGGVWAATLGGVSYMEREMSGDVEAEIYTEKMSYTNGEALNVYADVRNHGATVEGTFNITASWPNGTTVSWWSGETAPFPIPLTLGGGLVIEGYGLHSTHVDTMMMQKGTYTWSITYTKYGTGDLLAFDSYSFTIE